MDVEKTIRVYMDGVVHLSLATCSGPQPWVSEVHFAFDEDLNLYFVSRPSRRHSLEIAANSLVAGNIVEQHVVGQKVRGVYFEGRAEMLHNVDRHHPAYASLHGRLGAMPELLAEAQTEAGHKFYKISVSKFYLFDNRESNGQKYELAWK